MKNYKKVMKHTDNSRVYKMAKREVTSGCPICPPHKGCNRRWQHDRSWKEYRKTQWK